MAGPGRAVGQLFRFTEENIKMVWRERERERLGVVKGSRGDGGREGGREGGGGRI